MGAGNTPLRIAWQFPECPSAFGALAESYLLGFPMHVYARCDHNVPVHPCAAYSTWPAPRRHVRGVKNLLGSESMS